MLDIKVIREQADRVRQSIEQRHIKHADVDRLLEVDGRWRQAQSRLDELRGQRNTISATIKTLEGDERTRAVEQVKALKGELAEVEQRTETLKTEREVLLRRMPNLLADDVPVGRTDEQNVEVSRWGELPTLAFEPRNHVELGKITDTIDFDRAAQVTGGNFYYLKHEAALMELALQAYVAAHVVPRGFIPMITPDLARDEVLDGIGFAPRGPETQVYSIVDQELSLVGTAEITLGGYHTQQILEGAQLPLRYLGFSHCFRTEAGAYGKESRGLYRVHQFTKAEMFVLCQPQESAAVHEELLQIEEELLQGLQIPYRVVNVCTGELGAPAFKKYDIEAWMPGRSAYGEVTSCSNCTDFQSRRLNIRYRPEPKSPPQYVHMLNGTAVAVSRTLIAIFENYQQQDGSIRIPEALRPFMGQLETIPVRL